MNEQNLLRKINPKSAFHKVLRTNMPRSVQTFKKKYRVKFDELTFSSLMFFQIHFRVKWLKKSDFEVNSLKKCFFTLNFETNWNFFLLFWKKKQDFKNLKSPKISFKLSQVDWPEKCFFWTKKSKLNFKKIKFYFFDL